MPGPDPDRHLELRHRTPDRGSGRPPSGWPSCSTRWASRASSSSQSRRRTSLVAHWEPDGVDQRACRRCSCTAISTSCRPTPTTGRCPRSPARCVDDCVWGRGAVDMKDFDAMVLSVVRARARAGAAPRRPIRLIFTADEEAGSGLGAHWLVDEHPEVVEGCEEAIGEVGGFSLTVRDDLRLYLIQTAEKGMAWLNLIADGRAGHGSFRNERTRSPSSARRSPGSAATSGRTRSPTHSEPSWRRSPRRSKSILIPTGPRRRWPGWAASPGWSGRPCPTRRTRRCCRRATSTM